MVDSPILAAGGLLSLMASPMAPSPSILESASSRKRKLDASPCVDNSKASLGDPFYITPNAKSAFNNNPILLTPKAILPRLIIPLHWTVSSAQPRTFNARLTTLDTPGTILIVKYENERQLAAVERVERDKFVLLRMSSSVKLTDVRRLAVLAKKSGGSEEVRSLPFGMMTEGFQEEWWDAIKSDETPATASQSGTERVEPFVGKVQMKLSEVLKSAKSPKPKPEPEVPEKKKPETKKEAKEKKAEDSKFLVPASKALRGENSSPQEVLDQIRSNYFETLYIAKTPLAYFAKSTLAKARNIFRLDNQGQYARLELLKFLKSLRVPMKRQDMKYSRAISQIVNEDPVDDSTLFSEGEREYINRWVAKTMSDEKTRGRSASQNEQRLQRKISDLRLRETELQIILMLEIMAISSKFPPAVLKALEEATEAKDKEDTEGGKKKKSKKKSKKAKKDEMTFLPEPSVHLDLLVDRLCIWQLVGSALVLDDAPSSQQQNKDNRDHIQHFTVEVVMTYFASRLPEVCSSIKRRCSGKTPTSSFVEREAAKKEKQKVIQEQKSVKDSQSQAAKRPPSLARSVTAPASLLARTEREGSLAASIFGPGESQYTAGTGTTKPADALSSISRGGVMTSKKFDRREVQINRKKPAAAKSEDSQSKLQEVIKSAIQGIAKPNRAAAAQEFASANSQRLRVANGKKLQKPLHKPKQNVQVAATPRANRRIQHYNLSRPAVVQSPIVEEDPVPSSDAVVPQSTVKKSNKRKDFSVGIFDEELTTPTKVPRLARHMTALLPKEKNDNVGSGPTPFTRSLSDPFARAPSARKDIVEDTPRKPKDMMMMDSLVLDSPLPSGLQETPTRPSARNLLTTPSKRRFDDYNDIENSGGVMLGSPVPRAIMRSHTFSTPINKRTKSTSALMGAENAIESQQSQMDEIGGVSIYEQLGWDDY